MPRTVHLFIPCFVDQLFPQTGIAAVEILRSLGCEVLYPEAQTCCGQPAFNSGYWQEAAVAAERFLQIFKEAEYVVAPSGSCVSMVKIFFAELPLSPQSREIWQSRHGQVFELSQFLHQILGVNAWEGRFPARVTYHDACHGLRELNIAAAPRQLLQSIDGLEYVEMSRPDTCCGFGGTFSVKFPGISTAMAENKARWIRESGAEYVTACDASCLMQIDGYLKRHKLPVKTLHLAELLWQAKQNG